MKNEVFARAVTNIDDELITEAHADVNVRRFTGTVIRRISLAAACLAVIITASLLLTLPGGTKIAVNGTVLSSGSSVTVGTPSALSDDTIRAVAAQDAHIRLDIKSHGKVTLDTSDGGFEILSADGELIFSGTSFTADSPVTVDWTVLYPVLGQEYRLSVNDAIITMTFDGDNISVKKTKN